jgi:hypothetical protein
MRAFYAMFVITFLSGFVASALTAANAPRGNLVVVWHENAHEVWVGRGPNAGEIEAAVLKRCNTVMRKGCGVARSAAQGFVAIARRADGLLVTAPGNSSGSASKDALAFCLQAGLYCELEEVIEARSESAKMTFRDPRDKQFLVRRYGAIIWQRTSTSPVQLWVAAGRASAALATSDALANCKADAGEGCETVQWGANTTLVAYLDNKGSVRVMQGKDLEQAFLYQDRFCKENKLTCTTELVVDAATEETWVYSIKR